MKEASKSLVKDEVERMRSAREIFKARYAELTQERILILSIFSYFQQEPAFFREKSSDVRLIDKLRAESRSKKNEGHGLCLNWRLFGRLIELMSNEVSEMRVGLDLLQGMKAEGKVTNNDTGSESINQACGKLDAVILRLKNPSRAEEVKAHFKELMIELLSHPVVLMWNPFTKELLISP